MSNERAVGLLKQLIATESVSRQEQETASIIERYLTENGIDAKRQGNNVWAKSKDYDPKKPTVLLNSHHDTVRPTTTWTRNPFEAKTENGRIYGLGSNDAGASVVSLVETFLKFQEVELNYNLILGITSEEEVGGEHGMRAFLPMLKDKGISLSMAIVGEPTNMRPAIAERGLVVLDCKAKGVSGHAARHEGVNAIYQAIEDIERLRRWHPERVSKVLGEIGVAVTQINAGTQHNVIPDRCEFVVDIRTTDAYTNEETVELIKREIRSEATPRSTRVRASVIDEAHPLAQAAIAVGGEAFVSPTTSDMSLMHELPSVKIGPGDSSRSHKADEYIEQVEIDEAIEKYTKLLETLNQLNDGQEIVEQGH